MTKFNPEQYRNIFSDIFTAAVSSALPENCIAPYLPEKPVGKTYIIGAGKAASKMAQIFETLWDDEIEGMVITRYGHSVPTKTITTIEASHPVPDQSGINATNKIFDLLHKTTADDLVICLLSGGGSSLMTCPEKGLEFEEIQKLNQDLLSCGASIHEINTVRKHLNRAFGGKLAKAAAPAKLVTLAISDVAGDNPSTIASGPTVADPTTLEQARGIIQKYQLNVSQAITDHLNDDRNETPKKDDPSFDNTHYHLIATPQKTMEAAAEKIKQYGLTPLILSSTIEGETNNAAQFHISIINQIINHQQPIKPPCAIISGGETTVHLTGNGEGGPNTQFMLASAILLDGCHNVYAMSCDTDGIDGSKDNAGAMITPTTIKRAQDKGITPKEFLENNDSYNFFERINDCIAPGPTHTNVNDLRIFIIL